MCIRDSINGIPLGCLGIPEFGTDFAMQMVIDAKPTEFSDLIRISGLSHGTDAVSYTHLDVYKRQTCSNYIRWKWKMGKKQRNAKKLRTYGRG